MRGRQAPGGCFADGAAQNALTIQLPADTARTLAQMTTPLDALIAALSAASAYDARAEMPAEGLLWCDPANDFSPLLPLLRQHLPNLLTLGEYEPERRQGPAVWLRTAAGRALPNITWAPDVPAIVYLPGVARDALRAAEDCPPPLQLFAWLVVGGATFAHPMGATGRSAGFSPPNRRMAAWGWKFRRTRLRAMRCCWPHRSCSPCRWQSCRADAWTPIGCMHCLPPTSTRTCWPGWTGSWMRHRIRPGSPPFRHARNPS